MKARVKWLEDLTLIGESASGHAVVMDGPLELGGHILVMEFNSFQLV
jgi:putative redox protein